MTIRENALGPEHPSVAAGLNNLAGLYLEAGRSEEAFKIFKEQDTPEGMGRYHLSKRNYQEAEKEFLRALKGTEEPHFLIANYTGLGLSYEGQGDYLKAKEYFEKGIEIIEGQWATLSAEAKRSFLAGQVGAGFSRLEPYEGMVRVLLKEKGSNYQRKALYYVERVKSRRFLEILATRPLKGRTKEDRSVLEKEKGYQQDLFVLRKRIEVMEQLGDKAPEGELKTLEKELKKKAAEYEDFITRVKLKDLELASLISVVEPEVDKIQSLLDKETTLLEYYTAKDTL